MNGTNRFRRASGAFLLASCLLISSQGAAADVSDEGLAIPDYTRWRVEEEATTYRPGTDLQFYPLELTAYVNPGNPSEMMVELRREDVLYILYHYRLTNSGAKWAIYMDAGFANAPCGFFDPQGQAARRYLRIDLTCLRDTERVDIRSGK